MTTSGYEAFDGTSLQEGLSGGGKNYRCTSLSLIALCQGAFVVVSGTDQDVGEFSDDDIQKIFEIFDGTVDENKGANPQQLHAAIIEAIGNLWTVSDLSKDCDCSDCPFDLKINMSTRIVFHMHIPHWSFEDARIKFKTSGSDSQFSDLDWLSLNGVSKKPNSFCIVDQDTDKVHYQFALFARVQQGQSWTRVIIDPEIMNDGRGP